MDLAGTVEFLRMEDGSSRLNVTSEDSAILIGRKGRNLSAMQYLINRIISRNDTAENTERLVVDVEGYVDRRRASLKDMARTFAERAKSATVATCGSSPSARRNDGSSTLPWRTTPSCAPTAWVSRSTGAS